MTSSKLELNSLSQCEVIRIVDSAGASTHVLLPGITARFSSTTSLLFSSESTTDFSTRCTDIAVNYTTVTASWANPVEIVLKVLCEKSRG